MTSSSTLPRPGNNMRTLAAGHAGSASNARWVPGVAAQRLKLLVVDSSELDFEMLVATLRNDSIAADCTRANTMDRLSRALATQPWDAVFTDHPLPGYPGIASSVVLRNVREAQPHCPVLVVASTLSEEGVAAVLRQGADDALMKGRLARLGPALMNAMAGRRAHAEEARAHEALKASREELRQMLAHVEQVVERERLAIAHEIHDEMGAALTALRLDLAWISAHGGSEVAERARRAGSHLSQALDVSQQLQRRLRPTLLEQGLVPALEALCEEAGRHRTLKAEFSSNVRELVLPPEAELAVFRATQEALTNALKHAKARSVRVDLTRTPDSVSVEISDDGVGIDAGDSQRPGSFGLRGMSERAERLGGFMEISPIQRNASSNANGTGQEAQPQLQDAQARGGTVVLFSVPVKVSLPAQDRGDE